MRKVQTLLGVAGLVGSSLLPAFAGDRIQALQTEAIENNKAAFGHWGNDAENYKAWSSHSNRLIPVYTFGSRGAGKGVDLDSYTGENSPYRSESALKKIYGFLPEQTLNPAAVYCDQTNIYDMQMAAAAAGKKHIFLIVFDGMDWQTTRLASIYRRQRIEYDSGRGTGLHFQDYTANGTTQFGYMCTAPHNAGSEIDVNSQTILKPGSALRGGYEVELAGEYPWSVAPDLGYPISKSAAGHIKHAYTDSSSSATSMTAGIKTANNVVNVDANGAQVLTAAHRLQEQGWSVGAVTSVPVAHATPAATYAHNVSRDDYQDITRDLVGLKSVSHPDEPLSGLDVLIGTGWGFARKKDNGQGKNFVPGNAYFTDEDLKASDVANGGKYVTAIRTPGRNGAEVLAEAAEKAVASKQRLLGYYGVASTGHLPFATADGDYKPTVGRSNQAEVYTPEDITENPKLADFATAAIRVLSQNPKGFWLLVEAGDVDWANHDNNIDNSIGAVTSGDLAVKAVTDWVDQHSNWDESLVIVTADHGHYFIYLDPTLLIDPQLASRP